MVDDQSSSITNPALISRARQRHNEASWSEFVQRYGPKVLGWSRQWCSQEADAQDLAQEILLKVWHKLPEFTKQPGGTFRGWLWTLSRRVFLDACRRRKMPTIDDHVLVAELDKRSIEFARSMEREFDEELMYLACAYVRQVVDEEQWRMFEQVDVQHLDARQVAKEHGKSLAALRMNCVRIRKQIREQMIKIENSFGSPSDK